MVSYFHTLNVGVPQLGSVSRGARLIGGQQILNEIYFSKLERMLKKGACYMLCTLEMGYVRCVLAFKDVHNQNYWVSQHEYGL